MGFTLPRLVDHFFSMEDEDMTNFFSFRDELSCYDGDDVLLPERPSLILKDFCKDYDIRYKISSRYGVTFVHIPMDKVDQLCDLLCPQTD